MKNTITLTDNEIQYIVNVLSERPYKESARLIVNIVQQFSAPPVSESSADADTDAGDEA